MSVVASPSQASVEAVFDIGTTGLVGTAEYRIDDNQGATVLGPSALGIAEIGASGLYVVTFTAPGAEGQFSIVFSDDATFAEGTVAVEDLLVTLADVASSLPPLVPTVGEGPGVGPCSAWTTADEVEACCGLQDGSDSSVYDTVVVEASQVLYELSTRKFSGLCQRTVRPCRTRPTCWDGTSWRSTSSHCGCNGLSEIRLAGRPIRTIVEVKIDGAIVDPDTYKIMRGKLIRVRDPADTETALFWPSCQHLDLEDTEDGTFSITYTHGMQIPQLGRRAAAELACELYKACRPAGDTTACALPAGVVEIVRANVTIKLKPFLAWAYDPRQGWQTGLRLVDLFLNAYNPYGQRKRPAVWSPDVQPFAKAEPIAG